MYYKKNIKGFTLVELIVVITILAILGTIAFISLQGYSKSSRDSVRISDLSTMKTSLELFNLDAGKYPVVTDGFIVTYSGSEIWSQGTFGENTINSVDKLDKIPLDPLVEREYTYSTTKNKQEYQLGGIMEGDTVVLNNGLLNNAIAGDITTNAIVVGNYNGALVKTLTGTDCKILSLPSIISSLPKDSTDLETILTSSGLVYNGHQNLPSNYRGSKYNSDGGFGFISNKLIAYSDNNSCNPLYDGDDTTSRGNLIFGLQEAYSGTILKNIGNIHNILSINTNDLDAINMYSSTLVNNSLGGNLELGGIVEQISLNFNGYAISEVFGWISTGLTVDGSTIGGYGQSEVLGWICFDISCGSTVTRSLVTGNLSGYALSETFGWIDMDGVNINNSGDITGYGQSELLGWIEF